MAAIIRRQPLTIKQQVEELKNWHKQQQSKLDPKRPDIEHSGNNESSYKEQIFPNTASDTRENNKLTSNIIFDEIPIKVANTNFNALVENNIAPINIQNKTGEQTHKPKFCFLKKGEGIARFNMQPRKIAKKTISRRHGLNLIKDTSKSNAQNKEIVKGQPMADLQKAEGLPTLHVPDVKLNFRSWKSIFSGDNPEDMLEKAINNNQLELFEPNSSIDSSTASLMEKLIAIGKNKLFRDTEELRAFEAIEEHMLDSSFCSTSSHVVRLMENAVMSTPDKEKCYSQQSNVSNQESHFPKNQESHFPNQQSQLPNQQSQLPNQQSQVTVPTSHSDHRTGIPTKNGKFGVNPQQEVEQRGSPINCIANEIDENIINDNNGQNRSESDEVNIQNILKQRDLQPVAFWTRPEPLNNQYYNEKCEESAQDLEQSLHVRFAEEIDYKSFVENSQSIDSGSKQVGNESGEFDESHEWKEGSINSSDSCSQCSELNSSTEDIRPFSPCVNEVKSDKCPQREGNIHTERLNVGDLKTNNLLGTNNLASNDVDSNLPPVLLIKLRELEDEIKVFREENSNIKALREHLEKERNQIQEEKRRLRIEKKRLQKEIEEEKRTHIAQLEEEKQKLAKEKIVFEKYSKTITRNPSKEERKEIQALREQLSAMKEELNKKESRWGAAQARVRTQVKSLEEDNKKLRGEIENLRKQAKYWDLFNQKKKGKPFNNTRLIHAIGEHISNIVLDDENGHEKNSENAGYFNQKTLVPNITSITQEDIKSMYGVKVIKENVNKKSQPVTENKSESNTNPKNLSSTQSTSKAASENNFEANNYSCESNTNRSVPNISIDPAALVDQRMFQNEDRCQKSCFEQSSVNVIKEVADGNGNVEIVFPNGNVKKINRITGSEKYIYVNGDVEEVTCDGAVKYYYSKSRIWQTTLPDGLEIVDFPDGQVEKRHTSGIIEIIYSNNNKKFSYPDGSHEVIYMDGTKLKVEADKTQILILPNGQKEIHTEEFKRREYPDGTMKTLYPDGTTETVYSNGRVRLKDKDGNLVMDSNLTSHS